MKKEFNKTSTYSSSKSDRYIGYIMPMQTYNSLSSDTVYMAKLPSNIDAFSKLKESINALSNLDVKRQTTRIVYELMNLLNKASMQYSIPNSLKSINVIEQNDCAALVEWNFQNFRVGFSIEPTSSESSYYIISEERGLGSFTAETNLIGSDIEKVIVKILEYVIRNT